jgi:DNA invertase Pin-like site-specific DNA recombinase
MSQKAIPTTSKTLGDYPMKIGYARVSTLEQHLDVQLAKLQQAGCVKIYQEKRSGLDDARPELAKCLDYIRRGKASW